MIRLGALCGFTLGDRPGRSQESLETQELGSMVNLHNFHIFSPTPVDHVRLRLGETISTVAPWRPLGALSAEDGFVPKFFRFRSPRHVIIQVLKRLGLRLSRDLSKNIWGLTCKEVGVFPQNRPLHLYHVETKPTLVTVTVVYTHHMVLLDSIHRTSLNQPMCSCFLIPRTGALSFFVHAADLKDIGTLALTTNEGETIRHVSSNYHAKFT